MKWWRHVAVTVIHTRHSNSVQHFSALIKILKFQRPLTIYVRFCQNFYLLKMIPVPVREDGGVDEGMISSAATDHEVHKEKRGAALMRWRGKCARCGCVRSV
jgi:hypothetical protein